MSSRIHFLGNIPAKCYLALSGGADSMAILDFLLRGRKDVVAIHFNHGTKHGEEAEMFVRKQCDRLGVPLRVGKISLDKPIGKSPEEHWRDERYKFFSRFNDRKIITCHNLDDQVESHLFFSIRNGHSKLIPYRRSNIIRPFLITKKSSLESWCSKKEVPFIVDPGNSDYKHTRSFIRGEMVPQALRINPGIYKLISKRIRVEFKGNLAGV